MSEAIEAPTEEAAPEEPPARHIEVGGGMVVFYGKLELTARRRRPMEELQLQVGGLLAKLAKSDDEDEFDPETMDPAEAEANAKRNIVSGVEITERQAYLLAKFQDAISFMYLKSWTLPYAMPKTPDDLLDLPGYVLDAIEKQTAKLYAHDQTSDEGFDLSSESLKDTESPTGGSAG